MITYIKRPWQAYDEMRDCLSLKSYWWKPLTFIKERSGVLAAVIFLDTITISQPPLESVTYPDLSRARDIMSTYADARFDFVDCCIMALAERLNITQIYTFDRRDFAIFRPNRCPYLELLP